MVITGLCVEILFKMHCECAYVKEKINWNSHYSFKAESR